MSIYLNADCMNPETGLPSFPDKHFDLAIVDPPYGIGESGGKCRTRKKHNNKVKHEKKHWDNEQPSAAYWDELKRVSKDQIVWGANYFTEHLPPSMGWIFWDKQIGGDFSDGELAYTSFERALKMVSIWSGNNGIARLHPTQKSQALYRWLLKNYAKQGDLILDTHVGSASSLVVFEEMGFDYVGYELDADYYRDSCKRLEVFRAQPKLFTGSEIFRATQGEQGTLFEL